MPSPSFDGATRRDETRQVATSPDQYTLTVKEALIIYQRAGHPRTERSVQRYCTKGHLVCLSQETTSGERLLITPASIERHIAQIIELASATSRDLPRQVAAAGGYLEPLKHEQPGALSTTPTLTDISRLVATGRDRPPVVAEENIDSSLPHMPNGIATGRDLSRQDAPASAATLSPTRFADLAIYDHPYVKKLEDKIDRLETRYEAQVRRTEEIQIQSQERLVELQRMTTIGQSKTLADFMLEAKNWLITGGSRGASTIDDQPAP